MEWFAALQQFVIFKSASIASVSNALTILINTLPQSKQESVS